MSDSVKRYEPASTDGEFAYFKVSSHGTWVKYVDYSRLEAETRWAMEIVVSTSDMALSLPVTGHTEMKLAVARDRERAQAWLAAHPAKDCNEGQ